MKIKPFRVYRAGDAQPHVGTSVLAPDGTMYTRRDLTWLPGPCTWTGLLDLHGELTELGTVKIQPVEQPDRTQPYPYYVLANGKIAGQDFWKGNPARLNGFQARRDVRRVDVLCEEFIANPLRALGRYPVFICRNGDMFNLEWPIQSIQLCNGLRVVRDEAADLMHGPAADAQPSGDGPSAYAVLNHLIAARAQHVGEAAQ